MLEVLSHLLDFAQIGVQVFAYLFLGLEDGILVRQLFPQFLLLLLQLELLLFLGVYVLLNLLLILLGLHDALRILVLILRKIKHEQLSKSKTGQMNWKGNKSWTDGTYLVFIILVGQLLLRGDPLIDGVVLRLLAQGDHLLLVLFFGHVLVILLLPLHPDFRRFRGDPLDVVLFESYDDVDALEDVRDVVNPPFLHFELLHRLVQVDAHLGSLDQELYELFGEFHQTVLLAALLLFSASILETRILFHVLRIVG